MKPQTHEQQLKEIKIQWRQKTSRQMPDDIAALPLSEIHKRLAVQRTHQQVDAERRAIYSESMVYFDNHKLND